MRVVKLLDKEKAEYLKSIGYKYKEEQIGNKIVYSFFETPLLLNELVRKFDKGDYYIDHIIKFDKGGVE